MNAIALILVVNIAFWLLPTRFAVALLAGLVAFLFVILAQAAEAPQEAQPYQRALTREARALWGLDAPVAVLAGQIEQESAWQPNVCSHFACGLAQFTPATAKWISGAYPKELGSNEPFNPEWAMRALVTYDHQLYQQMSDAAEACSQWSFTLSAYNGGAGWVHRDRQQTRNAQRDGDTWFGSVELYSTRALSATIENRAYPRRILGITQFHYATWGRTVSCPISKAT